jgi:predicted transcriptional regulator
MAWKAITVRLSIEDRRRLDELAARERLGAGTLARQLVGRALDAALQERAAARAAG